MDTITQSRALEIPGRSQDLALESLALSEAELLARVSDLVDERDTYAEFLRLSLGELHQLTGRLERTEASLRRLLELSDEAAA